MTRLAPSGEFHPQLHSAVMRETQVAAFEHILSNGLLSRLRQEVYETIFEHQHPAEGITSGEIDRIISRRKGAWTRSASPRLVELVRLGVVEELPSRRCKETGMTVLAYRTTCRAVPDEANLRKHKAVRRPSRSVLRKAVMEMRLLRQLALSVGLTPHSSYDEVAAWLEET